MTTNRRTLFGTLLAYLLPDWAKIIPPTPRSKPKLVIPTSWTLTAITYVPRRDDQVKVGIFKSPRGAILTLYGADLPRDLNIGQVYELAQE